MILQNFWSFTWDNKPTPCTNKKNKYHGIEMNKCSLWMPCERVRQIRNDIDHSPCAYYITKTNPYLDIKRRKKMCLCVCVSNH
ncbi:hypothetical protein TanjilG_30959 [Lupinus angustifolius]|uniref:Uncharacterized protein n=1 Tax=Lupinus angustifolius TaxID=3871 RepID=A0A1J7HSV4_LUPAN|nr:hypothetical protein TanjilG_30959 [Lupinus angustifolius]